MILFATGFVTCSLLYSIYYYMYIRRKIYFLKYTDQQTQLLNYQYLQIVLEQIKHDSYIIIIDIDDFKRFNSDYSYKRGDEVILTVRDALLFSSSKHSLYAFRYRSGDEFVLVSKSNTFNFENITLTVNDINKRLSDLDATALITLSMGITVKTSATRTEEVIKMLEDALLIAKTKKGSIYYKSLIEEGWIN